MSLKGDRLVLEETVKYFCNTASVRGGIVCRITAGSGVALDSAVMVAGYAANPSGLTPVGLLQNDVVNYDLTKQHINYHKDEVQIGGKVNIGKKGWWTTNSIVPGVTPVAGQTAYLGGSGLLQATSVNLAQNPWVGEFETSPDEDGYVSVNVNLPR